MATTKPGAELRAKILALTDFSNIKMMGWSDKHVKQFGFAQVLDEITMFITRARWPGEQVFRCEDPRVAGQYWLILATSKENAVKIANTAEKRSYSDARYTIADMKEI